LILVIAGQRGLALPFHLEESMPESDLGYYERRLAEERANIVKAASREAVWAHRRMAERYAVRLEALRRTRPAAIELDVHSASR
jgi:hypothetical protein